MLIRNFYTPGLSIVSYLIFDEIKRQGIVIDPTRHIENYLASALQEKIEIVGIIETHVHADFVSGAQELKAALKNQPKIYCSAMGGTQRTPFYTDQHIHDQDEIRLGNIRLQAWHTPGHTPEHLIWIAFDELRSPTVPVLAFTGDLLFVGSIGRPDLLGKEEQSHLSKLLYQSIFQTLSPLQDFVEIYPAHTGGSLCGKEIGARRMSTLGYERLCNPWLMKQPYESWRAALVENMGAPPAYFSRMKTMNLTGLHSHTPLDELPPLLNPQEVLQLIDSCLIIDTRNIEAFSSGHLKNALNIPLGPSFTTWAGSTIPATSLLIVVIEDNAQARYVQQSLRLIGIDTIQGFCSIRDFQKPEWKELLHPSPMITVAEVAAKKKEMYILDVRTPSEWTAGHIPEAHHIELTQVPASLNQLPKNIPIAVICQSGNRASLIASFLQREGLKETKTMGGGMQAWGKSQTTDF